MFPIAHFKLATFDTPIAQFTYTPDGQCSSTSIQFTNTSTGDSLTYLWNFGDGATDTTKNPSHQFTPSGLTQTFQVSLTVTNKTGSNTIKQNVNVLQSPDTQLGGTGKVSASSQYFAPCTTQATTFTFTNLSSTASTNSHYSINWNDGTPNFDSNTFSSVTHQFNLGLNTFSYTVTSPNGCQSTATYYAYVGGTPSIGLSTQSNGNTSICTGSALSFNVTQTANNPPGTIYIATYSDGYKKTYNTAPDTITHYFLKSSNNSNTTIGNITYPNSFSVTIEAVNPCTTASQVYGPIYVSDSPKPVIQISPGDTVCAHSNVTLTDSTANYYSISPNGQSKVNNFVWKISPNTFTVSGGSARLGNDFGQSDPTTWATGASPLNISFTVPGTYTILLKTGSATCGGLDSTFKTICVNPAPTATFTVDKNQGCGPLTVQTTNTSILPNCGNNNYLWTVSYSNTGCSADTASFIFLNGTSKSSANPQFQFNNPGVYSLKLTTTNSKGICSATSDTLHITVKAKPVVTLSGIKTICEYSTILPTATVANCYSATVPTYSWTFPGGLPANATVANPGSILYNNPGKFPVTLAVTNECGTTTVTDTVVVNPPPVATLPPNITLCSGSATGMINFTSNVNGTTFTWTNDNISIGLPSQGVGNIASFTAKNISGTAQTAHIVVTPKNGCTGLPDTLLITVNPTPPAPAAATSLTYCLNDTAPPLSATAANGNSIIWYTNANDAKNHTNGTATPPVQVTSAPLTANYYVTQVNSFGCESPATTITVTVNPPISNNTIGASQIICAGTLPDGLTSTATLSGGNNSYNYTWISLNNGQLDTLAHSVNYSFPGTLNTGTYKFWRVVTSGSCQSISDTVTITVQGALSNYDISGAQTICSGSIPAQLTGQIPAGGTGAITYQWQSSIDNSSWAIIPGATGINIQPPALTATTYYQRIVSTATCSAVSGTDTITVNPVPVINTVPGKIVCNGSSVQAIIFSSNTTKNTAFIWTSSNTSIGLVAATGTGNTPVFLATNNTKAPIADTITVVATYTSAGVSCTGTPVTFTITVLPTINISPNPPDTVCAGTQVPAFFPVNDALPFASGNVSYLWTVSQNIGLVNGSGNQIPSFTALNKGNSALTATITVTPVYNYSGETCDGTPVSYTITVNALPTVANAGKNEKICTTIYQLNGNTPIVGTGTWTQTSGPPVVFANPNLPNTKIAGLQKSAQYQFTWTISNNNCAVSSSIVTIDVLTDILASFTKSTSAGCGPQSISFNNTSTPLDSANYIWNFGNGQTSANIQPGPILFAAAKLNHDTTYYISLTAVTGCASTAYTDSVIIAPPLKSIFSPAPTEGCSPLIVNITNQSTGIANTYTYSFGDGSPQQVLTGNQPIQHTYFALKDTIYTIKLKAANACGADSSSYKILVHPNSVQTHLVVNGDNLTGCAPYTVTFFNNSTGATNYKFNFGDNSDTTTYKAPETVVHTFTQPGTFKVTITGSNVCSTADTTITIVVIKPPMANFTPNKTQYCLKDTAFFINNSSVSPNITYLWNYGDNTTSSLFNPFHVYKAPGTYTVTLTAMQDTAGTHCNSLTSHRITVDSLPTVTFTSNYTAVHCVPFLLSVSAQPTNATQVTWDFGDPAGNPTTALAAQHLYSVPGTYLVKMIAYNANGCSDTTIQTYQFNPSPIASFSATPSISSVPYIVNVTNTSANADSYQWYLVNNKTGAKWNVQFNPPTATSPLNFTLDTANQKYILMLVATNQYGCKPDTAIDTLYTAPKPIASLTLRDSVSCTGELTINVINTSQNATSYIWSFGDSSPNQTAAIPTHTYGPGSYVLQLIAVNGLWSDTVKHTITVTTPPKAAFMANVTNGCDTVSTTFTNLSVNANAYQWIFGDGDTTYTTVKNTITHNYNYTQSPYTVKLIAIGLYGCADTAVMKNLIYVSILTANFEALPDSVIKIPDYTFNFNNLTSSNLMPGDSISYSWSFGDGTLPSTEKSPGHTYRDTGRFAVTLYASDTYGCKSTKSETVHIMTVPQYLYVPNAFEPASIKSELQTFNVRAVGLAQYNLKIFNKWGQLVFQTSTLDVNGSPTHGWDGYMQGRPAPQDAYAWEISAKFIDGTEWKGMKYNNSGSPSTTGIIHLIR